MAAITVFGLAPLLLLARRPAEAAVKAARGEAGKIVSGFLKRWQRRAGVGRYSMTSSARASNIGATSSPSEVAALRLMISR